MLKKIFITIFALVLSTVICNITIAEEETINEQINFNNPDLDKIVVTASKLKQSYKNTTTDINIISSEDIKNSGATEITELLDMVTSLDVLEYGSFGSTKHIHMRGTSASQSLILVNGRPVTTPRDGLADLNQIPLSNIERIEVMRGPAATMYGANAIGGVVNVITKNGTEDMQTELVNKFGSYQTKFVYISNGYKINNFDYFISYDYLTSDGHKNHNFCRSHNPNIDIGYTINEDNRVSFLSGFYRSMVGTPGKITNADLDDRQFTKKNFLDLSWNGKISQDQDILIKIYENTDRLEFIESYDPDNLIYDEKDTHQTKVYGLDMQYSKDWSEIFRTAFGSNCQLHNLNSSTSSKRDYSLKAFYSETEVNLSNNITWKFGSRWDDYSNFGSKVSPSTSFSIWFLEQIKLHGLIAKSFRAPTFNDLYWPREDWGIWGGVEGNSSLKPEEAISYELGVGGYLLGKIKADITSFITESKDLIEWTMDNTLWWRPTNIGSAKIKGMEFESEYNIFENVKLNFNYTYLDAKNKDNNNWLIYRPRSYYKLRLTYFPLEKIKIGMSARYKTKRFTNNDNTSAIAPYFAMDTDISYKTTKNVELMLSINNIFDKTYQEEENYSLPGLNVMAGFRLKL